MPWIFSHDGGSVKGDFIQTLDLVDVFSDWCETKAVKNKAQRWVFEAKGDKEKASLSLLGIDSDNGSRFINAHLLRFCGEERITFAKNRPYRKDDSCHVEQKNLSSGEEIRGILKI